MGFDNIKQFNRIEAQNIEEHGEKIKNEIKKIQLFYADSLYKKLPDSEKGKVKFFNLLSNNSDILFEIQSIVDVENDGVSDVVVRDELLPKYIKEIDNLYNEPSDKKEENLEKIYNYIINLKIKSKEQFPEKWEQEKIKRNSKEVKKAGFFDFDISSKETHRDLIKFLEKVGFSNHDEFLQVHFPALFEQDLKLNSNSIKESFEKLANVIVEKYPQVQAVVGSSWLLDHPVVQRLTKFKIIDSDKSIVWSQFIDKNGQIDKDKLKILIETGEVPYKTLIGYIKTEDLLREYLPKEKRENIHLKEINEDWLKKDNFYERTAGDTKLFKETWDKGGLKDKDSLLEYFSKEGSLLKESLEKIGVYDDFFEFLLKKFGKKSQEIFEDRNDIELINIGKKVESFKKKFDEDKYKDKIVNLN